MPFLRRAVLFVAAAPMVAAAVVAAPVQAAQPAGWEPQLVRVSSTDPMPAGQVASGRRALPRSVGDERGLQVQTILAARAISAKFPEIRDIGGVRPDSMKWHPAGLAIDVIIPDWQTPAGRDLGDRITRYVMANAKRFGLEYVIWQRMYRPASGTPHLMDDYGDPDANHYTHVHISTYGGGYPTGDEIYYSD